MTRSAVYSNEPARGWVPWGALAPFLCVVFVAAPLLGVSEVLEHFGLVDARGEPIGLAGLCAFLLSFVAVGLVVLAWVHWVERRSLATIGLAPARRARTFLGGHMIGVATACAVVAAIWIAGGLQAGGYARAVHEAGALLGIAALLVGFAVQSSVEELLFRGWLMSAIARKLGVVIAVLLTAVVFTFLHYSPQQHWLFTLNMLLFSVFASAWALATRNIWGVMGWHAGWNWMMATGFELPVTGLDAHMPALLVQLSAHGSTTLTGGTQGPEGSLACSFFFAGAIALIAWRSREQRRSAGPAQP